MKKFFAIAFIAAATLVACNNSGEKKEETKDTTVAPAPADTTAAPAPADTTAAPAPADTTAAPAPAK
ncbi:MAG TPA: hypothetical protein VFV31_05295 [Chitinophagaceae bacterium]|nr:hypothetical protein [Chitinophagaceae bacterium]